MTSTTFELQKLVEKAVFACEVANEKETTSLKQAIERFEGSSEKRLRDELRKVFKSTGFVFDPEVDSDASSTSDDDTEKNNQSLTKPRVSPAPTKPKPTGSTGAAEVVEVIPMASSGLPELSAPVADAGATALKLEVPIETVSQDGPKGGDDKSVAAMDDVAIATAASGAPTTATVTSGVPAVTTVTSEAPAEASGASAAAGATSGAPTVAET